MAGYEQGYPPPQGYPPQGYPPQDGYPPQGYPQQGYPQQGYPPQGYPPPQGFPPQGYPPQESPQGYPPQGYPPQGPPQGYPPQGSPQGYPPQGYPPQQGYGGAGQFFQPGQGPDRLADVRKIIIKQKVTMMEAVCPMCEQQNIYETFDGDTGSPLYYVEEQSHCCCRVFLNPAHELNLKISPMTGGGQRQKGRAAGPPEMQVYRPFKCAGPCPAVCEWCQQEMEIYRGGYEDAKDAPGHALIGRAHEPACGGWFNPQIDVLRPNSDEPFSIIRGPSCCFGGLTEFCMDQEFSVDSPSGSQLGRIVRQRPEDLGDYMKTLFTDSDTFALEFPPGMPPQEKATLLGTLLLLDYMFFEQDRPWGCEDGKLTCTCCFWYCCGGVVPCKFACGGKDDKGGSPW
eukprot:TRINITY_DN8692_c0_g13_i1.p2 TRINITY_DN8692_c0_g13~~TRINITY_DN8692_c0_g13_i1.p2  ORF type:complete len:420 (+),score=108.49 TRINITY_DN8692_c0_g13_i1:68-1261(+)